MIFCCVRSAIGDDRTQEMVPIERLQHGIVTSLLGVGIWWLPNTPGRSPCWDGTRSLAPEARSQLHRSERLPRVLEKTENHRGGRGEGQRSGSSEVEERTGAAAQTQESSQQSLTGQFIRSCWRWLSESLPSLPSGESGMPPEPSCHEPPWDSSVLRSSGDRPRKWRG